MTINNVPFHWRRYKERYSLLGTECQNCKNVYFPIRRVCPHCRRRGKTRNIVFSGKGKVYSFTVIRAPPTGFEVFSPYAIGLIELDEGPKLISQIVDCNLEEIRIGIPVEACFRRLRDQGKEGIICYGFKFRLSEDSYQPRVVSSR